MRTLTQVTVTRVDSVVCLHIMERCLMDWDSVQRVEAEITQLLTSRRLAIEPFEAALFDLERVARCSKEFINVLLTARRRLAAIGCSMAVCGLTPHVAESFCVLNLSGTVFQVYASLNEALKQFPTCSPGVACALPQGRSAHSL